MVTTTKVSPAARAGLTIVFGCSGVYSADAGGISTVSIM
jgi:hypothetical protein